MKTFSKKVSMTAEKTEIKSFEDAEKAIEGEWKYLCKTPWSELSKRFGGSFDKSIGFVGGLAWSLDILRELEASVREEKDDLENCDEEFSRKDGLKMLRRVLGGDKSG